MDEPTDAGAAASSTSSSSLSSAEEDAFQDQLSGHGALAPPAADVGPPVPRRRFWAWAAARAAAPRRLREACENAAWDLVAWTRRGGAPRSLLVVSVSRCDQHGAGPRTRTPRTPSSLIQILRLSCDP